MIEAAGITVATGEGDLVVVAASPDAPVLPAALAAAPAGRSAGAVGLHVAGGRVAEVISTVQSSDGAAARAAALGRGLGLEVVRCPDRPGFLVGALLYPHLNDAVRMVQDGYASAADVDTAMTLGCGYPRGPLAMLDDIGAGRVQTVLAAMYGRSGDPAFAPAALLADHAAAGLAFHAGGPGQ
jgi:3-hydroxybutyryl-CoA dehydrogenase